MAKTIQITHLVILEDLQKILRESKDESEKTRTKIIIHTYKGLSRTALAKKLDIHVDTITDVVKRYNKTGTKGLKTNKGGRSEGNPKWDIQIFEDLKKEIHKQEKYWSIPKMVTWIIDNKKQEIPESTVWYHMTTSLHMSYKSARPHPLLGNRQKQEDFKKKG